MRCDKKVQKLFLLRTVFVLQVFRLHRLICISIFFHMSVTTMHIYNFTMISTSNSRHLLMIAPAIIDNIKIEMIA